MNKITQSFWDWYQRHSSINLRIASFLFLLQLFHLYWLLTDVVLFKLTGHSFFLLDSVWGQMSVIFDYTEVPALITTSLVYINNLRQRYSNKDITYLIFLNTQWLHILWITDEFVVEHLSSGTAEIIHWSAGLAWIAILIDFLELPVMYDTVKEAIKDYFSKKEAQ